MMRMIVGEMRGFPATESLPPVGWGRVAFIVALVLLSMIATVVEAGVRERSGKKFVHFPFRSRNC